MDLPKYKSHKVVSAARIQGIGLRQDDFGHVLDLGPHGTVNVSDTWVSEKHALTGGYYVVYEDGYASFSPYEAFNQGYTPEGSTFEQPKITGYRQLNEVEAALMNNFKNHIGGELVGALFLATAHVAAQRAAAKGNGEEGDRLDDATPERWIAIARTHFQEGLMALTRAVAQPGSF